MKEILRGVMIPMWNALSFFTTMRMWTATNRPPGEVQPPAKASNVLDRLDSVVGLADGRGDPRQSSMRTTCRRPRTGSAGSSTT